VNRADGSLVALSAGGRGFDQDGNGTIGTSEGFFAVAPQGLVQNRDGYRQTIIDSMQLVRVIEAGMDVDGDGAPDLDASRIYLVGGSQNGIYGAVFLALEPGVSAGVVNTLGGPVVDVARLSLNRTLVGAALGARTPSLLNGGPDPILPTNPFPFRENLPPGSDPRTARGLRRDAPALEEVVGLRSLEGCRHQRLRLARYTGSSSRSTRRRVSSRG